jgi:hypothetical protein
MRRRVGLNGALEPAPDKVRYMMAANSFVAGEAPA